MVEKYYYTFTTNPVKEGGFAEKLDKFTYGLLYPAFFGNMIYDLLLGNMPEGGMFDRWRLAIGIGILLFNIVDFMHLYVDVENSIGRELKNKSWAYILCDVLASIGIFVAFVLVKNVTNPAGLLVFCLCLDVSHSISSLTIGHWPTKK